MSALSRPIRAAALVGASAVAALVATAAPAAALPAFGTAPVTGTGGGQPLLRSVTVGQHAGFDRVVFTSRRGIGQYDVRYVRQVTTDGAGAPVRLEGRAFLQVTIMGTPWMTSPAPQPTLTPRFPALRQVKGAGEFEANASYGIGQATRAGFRVFTLANPARLVIDVRAPARSSAATSGAGTSTGDTSTGTSGTSGSSGTSGPSGTSGTSSGGSGPAGAGLPDTGIPILPVAAVGLGVLLTGLGGLLLARRRLAGRVA